MKLPCNLVAFFFLLGFLSTGITQAQERATSRDVHLIWMGGDDCPPCVEWRRFELPKLEVRPEFKAIKFTHVQKRVRESVPMKFFMPASVESFKEKLDFASNGRSGSPQGALMVNGEVYDYFQGTRKAEEILKMIDSVRESSPYPFTRCIKVSKEWRKCEVEG